MSIAGATVFFIGGTFFMYFILTSRYFSWKPFLTNFDKSLPLRSDDVTFHGDQRFASTQEIKPHLSPVICRLSNRIVRVKDCPGKNNPFEVGELKGVFLSSSLMSIVGWCKTNGDGVLLFRLQKNPSNHREMNVEILTDYVPQDTILVERPRSRSLPV